MSQHDTQNRHHRGVRGGILMLLLATTIAAGCSTTTPAMVMRQAETVSVTSQEALKTDLTSQSRGGSAMKTAGKGAGIGLVSGAAAGYVVGAATSIFCGPMIAVCAPVFVSAGAAGGAIGGAVVGAAAGGVTGGLAGSGISAEDAEGLDTVFAELEQRRDFASEFTSEFRNNMRAHRRVVDESADVDIAVDLIAMRLRDKEKDTVSLHIQARMLLLYTDGDGKTRHMKRDYGYESLAWPAAAFLDDSGALAGKEVDYGFSILIDRMLNDLQP